MLILEKVAVTGGLSCGKSSVCEIFKRKGAFVVSSDKIVHDLLSSNSSTAKAIVQLLGDQVVEEGKLDRAKIAKIVFEKKEKLKDLEKILHPAVLEEIEKQYNEAKNQTNTRLFIAEIPLLYEIDSQHLFDKVIAVTCDPSIAKMRFQNKTTLSEEEFDNRMIHQLPPEEKNAKADFTIHNNGDLGQLEAQVDSLYKMLTQE